jgi:hypothetical protein
MFGDRQLSSAARRQPIAEQAHDQVRIRDII